MTHLVLNTPRYKICRYDDGSHFVKLHNAEYGLLATGASATHFGRVLDMYRHSRFLDQAIHDFIVYAEREAGAAPEVRQIA